MLENRKGEIFTDVNIPRLFSVRLKLVTLGGLAVSVFAIGPKTREFKFGQGRWILRAIKIRSTTSFVERLRGETSFEGK
jgi:hypothetical protein